MWEWRVFWSLPVDGSHLDLWQLMQPGERRTDVYLVSTADVGVKLRGGSELEVKVRVAKDDGDAEKWKKLDGAGASGEDTIKGVASVLDKMSRDHSAYSAQLQAAREAVVQHSKLVEVKKEVKKMSVFTVGVTLEQTDIVLPGGVQYRTVCVESSSVNKIERMLEKPKDVFGDCIDMLGQILARQGDNPMGYPQFILEHTSA